MRVAGLETVKISGLPKSEVTSERLKDHFEVRVRVRVRVLKDHFEVKLEPPIDAHQHS